jgi:hypothetical protein
LAGQSKDAQEFEDKLLFPLLNHLIDGMNSSDFLILTVTSIALRLKGRLQGLDEALVFQLQRKRDEPIQVDEWMDEMEGLLVVKILFDSLSGIARNLESLVFHLDRPFLISLIVIPSKDDHTVHCL